MTRTEPPLDLSVVTLAGAPFTRTLPPLDASASTRSEACARIEAPEETSADTWQLSKTMAFMRVQATVPYPANAHVLTKIRYDVDGLHVDVAPTSLSRGLRAWGWDTVTETGESEMRP